MASFKASGSDRFHALFFQNQWDHIVVTICNWVKLVFVEKGINPNLDNTLIILIAKVHDPESFSHFQPINICSPLPRASLSYLFFAYDLIIFRRVEVQQAKIIKGIMESFCGYSSHKVNARKMNIFFSKGVNEELKEPINSIFSYHKV